MRISDWSSDVCSSDLGPGFVTKIGIFCTDIFLASLNRFVEMRRRHPVLQAGTFQDSITEGRRQMMDILLKKLEYDTRRLPQRTIRTEEHTSELQSLKRKNYEGI